MISPERSRRTGAASAVGGGILQIRRLYGKLHSVSSLAQKDKRQEEHNRRE